MKTHMARDELVHALEDVGQMMLADSVGMIAYRDIMQATTWIAMGAVERARLSLRILRRETGIGSLFVLGAEVHIALACEAFEKTYGPL